MKRLLTIDETVEFLGGIISRRTVTRLCSDGTFPSRKVGNRWLVSAEGLAIAVGHASAQNDDS
jgi:predicted DNA-binding transcriptional regulator AlpA